MSEREWLDFQREIAALRADLAMLRLAVRAQKALHHSNFQPRVPAGSPDGGEWTSGGGGAGGRTRLAGPPSGGRGSGRYGSNFPGATHGQLVRHEQAVARTERALAQVRRYDPTWQPRTTSWRTQDGVEGVIRHAEARALETESRLDQLRSGIGGNFGPLLQPLAPRTNLGPLSSRTFDGGAWIGLYRTTHNMPDLFGQPTWPFDKGTVAVTEIDGQLKFGVNSQAPGYTDTDIDVALRIRSILTTKYPDLVRGNIGQSPWDSVFHAESTILLRAARDSGGSLAGKVIDIQADREMCPTSCPRLLPKLGLELGNPTVTFVGPNGSRRTMRNGDWD